MDRADVPALAPTQAPGSAIRRGFGLHLSERRLLLSVVDLAIVNAVSAVSVAVGQSRSWREILAHPSWFVIATVTWLAVAFLLDAYNLRRAAKLQSGVALGAGAALATGLLYLSIPYITPPLPASRSSLFLFLTLLIGMISAWRGLYALVFVRPGLRRKLLVIGAGWAGRTIVDAIRANAAGDYEVVGFVDDDPAKQSRTVAGIPVIGTHRDLPRLLDGTRAAEVIVAITQTERMDGEMFQAIMDCHEQGVQVTQMSLLYEQLTGRVAVQHAGRNLYVVLPVSPPPSHVQQMLKRVFDVAVASLGLGILALLYPLVWLAARLGDGGPVLYGQVRVGRAGRQFRLLKFRTMVEDAEAAGPQWAERSDPRLTWIGRILRPLHLDEIPQALNILRGDLSFIGPRPERPEFVAELERQIPFYRARHSVRPGITGWAQINYGYGASIEDALLKLQYDLYYIKHQSLWLDVVIFLRTLGLIPTFNGR